MALVSRRPDRRDGNGLRGERLHGLRCIDDVSWHRGPGWFRFSNNYDRIIATAQQQAALGWRIEADVTNTHIPELRLTDRNGTPLAAAIDAHAERPLGSPDTTVLTFRSIWNGRFQAPTTLFSGQWDIMLTVHANGQLYSTTRRVIVK
jgi:nitrogen fixation protein FixH